MYKLQCLKNITSIDRNDILKIFFEYFHGYQTDFLQQLKAFLWKHNIFFTPYIYNTWTHPFQYRENIYSSINKMVDTSTLKNRNIIAGATSVIVTLSAVKTSPRQAGFRAVHNSNWRCRIPTSDSFKNLGRKIAII